MGDYTFSVTGYTGFEDEILRLRNANRSIAQSRTYLDWRYAKSLDAPDPLVFWIKSASGEMVGIASLIFRPYWLDNKPIHLGVIGDISLDANLRGKGLGRQLLLYVKHYLEQKLPCNIAFVIPNEAAHKSLVAAKWEIGGKLILYVLLWNPAKKLTLLLKSELFAKLLAAPLKYLFSLVARSQIIKGYEIQLVKEPDASFEELWKAVPKDTLILGDRNVNSLTWRYVDHPYEHFSIAKLLKKDKLAGYIIFTLSESDKILQIYDFMVIDSKDLLCMLALFLMHTIQRADLCIVRLVLNDKHPYRKILWRLGFIPRKTQTTFYLHWPNGFEQNNMLKWFISLGDKDI